MSMVAAGTAITKLTAASSTTITLEEILAAQIVTDPAFYVKAAAREGRGTAPVFARWEAAWREQAFPRAGSAADRILPVAHNRATR